MDITFHGAAQTVTGSQHLLTINGKNILLDCGLYQGSRHEALTRNRTFGFDPTEVDAVILSHAHIDHSGNLPSLVKHGFRGPIYATPATRDLCNYLLLDSAHIQESDVAFANKLAARRGEPATAEALYTAEDAQAALQLFVPHGLERPFEVVPGVRATFYEAGHILGSASLLLEVDEPGRRPYRFAFSGDIGRMGLPILRDPVFLHDVDYAIMESTYGGKDHRPFAQAADEFRTLARDTLTRGGKLIVPAFAVGRTQEVVYQLNQLMLNREIPIVPVFVDSPLAINASDVFRQHSNLFDDETRRLMDDNGDVFGFRTLRYTRTVDESKAINDVQGPAVIISASGMCETGRILHHLRNNVADPRNTILIVSWQAPNTLGRRLADREREVKIFGEWHKVNAQVATINGLSGHAGRDLLITWARALGPNLQGLFLVHGEPKASQALKDELQVLGVRQVYAPEPRDQVTV